MLENVYFWKNKNGGGGALNIIIIALVLIVLCAAGGGGGWYYFVKIPADQQAEQKQREIQERQSNIASVKDYYAKSLSGADFDKAIAVLGEIRKGIYPIDSLMSLESRSFSCDNKKCNLNLKLDKDALLTQPELIFWDKPYKASVPIAKKGKMRNMTWSIPTSIPK
jgi:Flagellar basal body-associated protein FliL.